MKHYYLTILFFMGFLCSAQSFGSYKITVAGTYNEASPVYETWLNDSSGLTIKYRKTAEGLQHLMEQTTRILAANKLKSSDTVSDDSKYADNVASSATYAQKHKSVKAGESEVKAIYQRGATLMQVFADKDTYEINIINPSK